MFKPVAMQKLHVLVLDKYLEPVTKKLGAIGSVHLIKSSPQSKEKLLIDVDCDKEIRQLGSLREQCRTMCESLGVEMDDDAEAAGISLDEIEQKIHQIADEYQVEESALNQLIIESGTLSRQFGRIEAYPFRKIRFSTLRNLEFLYMTAGKIKPEKLPDLQAALQEKVLILAGDSFAGKTRILLVTSRKNRWSMESELTKADFELEELPETIEDTPENEISGIKDKLAEVQQAIETHKKHVLRLRETWSATLNSFFRRLSESLTVAEAQQYFGKAEHMYCISGWLPKKQTDEAEAAISEASNGTAVVEFIEPEEDELVRSGSEAVPVKFQESRMLKPFQGLIAAFGAPGYNEVEPSLFVALSFVLMFGIMFGDIGQGLVIMLAGFYILKSRSRIIVGIKDAAYWLIFCGMSAITFGFMFGSFFGYEYGHNKPAFMPPPLLEPLQDPMTLFAACIGVGIVFILSGIFINIYNRLRNRQYFEGFLDKCGVLGVIFYLGSIGLGIKAAVAGKPTINEVIILVIVPLVIVFIREPLYNLITRKKHLLHEDPFSFILSSAIEVMETVSSFLGNTVSFARLGGFALSHAALCAAIYKIVEMFKDVPGSGLLAILIIVGGNIFVILLEGMVVTIQGVRLQYYELFSKFFEGEGVLYKPFRLREVRRHS